MINKLIRKISGVTDEQLKTVQKIRRLKAKYPSMRVVGRGTLVIDPKEIAADAEFKSLVSRVLHI